MTSTYSRRRFLTLGGAALSSSPGLRAATARPTLGQGDFRYQLVPGWGHLGEKTPVRNCHGIVCDAAGNIILFTDETKNNVIIYDEKGKLLHKWGTAYPGAHGLSLVIEEGREVLYLTDLKLNKVVKATPSGEVLDEWNFPKQSGKYEKASQYKPSWTLHRPNGDFYVLDGYGRDYIVHYDKDGGYAGVFGGQEGGIPHWGPHGGMYEKSPAGKESLLLAMSDQQNLLRLDLKGNKLDTIALPGGNPRQICRHGHHYFIAHLADNWPADRQSRGFISVLDKELRVVSNPGGDEPIYGDEGKLSKMTSTSDAFQHPHDLTVGKDGSLYVAQFMSGNTYPLKLERV